MIASVYKQVRTVRPCVSWQGHTRFFTGQNSAWRRYPRRWASPIFLVCLPSRRLSSAKNSEGLADRSGALSARQRTTACWRMARTITQQTAVQPGTQARVPLSADAWRSLHFIRFVANIGPDTWPGCFYRSAGAATIGRLPQVGAAFPRLCELAAGAASLAAIFMISGGLLCRSLRSGS